MVMVKIFILGENGHKVAEFLKEELIILFKAVDWLMENDI